MRWRDAWRDQQAALVLVAYAAVLGLLVAVVLGLVGVLS